MPTSPHHNPDQFLVHHQGRIEGPFDVDFIEAMIMAGVYPDSVILEQTATSLKAPLAQFRPDRKNPKPPKGSPTNSNPRKTGSGRKKTTPAIVMAQVLAGVAILVAIFGTVIVATSKKPQNPDYYSSPVTPSTRTTTTPSTWPATKTTQPTYSTPSPRIPSPLAETMVYRDASGRTYRVSTSDYNRLSILRAALSEKENLLNMEQKSLDSMHTELQRAQTTLDRYSQTSIDAYNRMVNQVNSFSASVQSLIDDYNRDVDYFNAELERVGRPIN